MPSLGLRGLTACTLVLFAGSAPVLRAECAAWPGEPDPLPQLGGGDAMLERWVSLRRDELRGLALLLEASDPIEARRLWLHAACLAPGDTEIAAALARTALPAVHRISVESAPAPITGPRATLGAAFDVLDQSAKIPVEGARDELPESFDFDAIDGQLATAASHLEQARFRSAAELADLARAKLARLSGAQPVRERRARLELIAATARVALGESDEARDCLERAIDADPQVSLDPSSAPPKLVHLLDEARARVGKQP